MAIQDVSEKGRPIPEAVVQESILQQAQAAATAQSDPTRLTRQEALLQDTDLISLNSAGDDIAPPAYGDIYGEIHSKNNSLGTSAYVTDDGRVNIRINQLNRRLSQIFTPALRQHVQSVQDSDPPPLPYIPPSLGGDEGVPPPPPLNVVIHVVGSRGDVQPFIALGKVLKDTYGHRVRLATHPIFKHFVQENGLEFFSIGGDPSKLMAFMVKNPALMPGFRSIVKGDVRQRRKDVAEYIQGCWRSCYQLGDGMGLHATDDDLSEPAAKSFVADCIIANPPSFAHIHCAEKLGIPLHIMFTMPYSPTQAFPHPLANIQSSNADPQLTNYISYAMIEVLSWQGLGDIINRFRARCLGLDPVSRFRAPGMLQRLKVPHTYCWSPALVPKPKDWASHISVSGYYLLNSVSDYTPTADLQAFLDAGPAPVYIGFGSIVLDDPNAMTELIFEAVKKVGQRVLISKGWGGMEVDEHCIPDGVFMLGNVPHDWLFKHVSCVVHHGGAGTMAAGITAGRPTLVVPFFGDQPFWGAMIARAGAGPDPIPHKQLTADKLADAINFCLKPESLERVKELASKIAAERGSDMGAQSFHQHLEVDRLRCTLAPSRAATWRIKRTQVRLSAFAACTLANAKLLDFHDLKLFRPQEYETDEGPWEPLSGGFVAACGAASGMAMGLADIPSETYKAFQLPFKYSRQQSQASVQTIAEKRKTSNVGERSTPRTSSERSQTSLDVQESLSRVQSPLNPSSLSSPRSNSESSSMSRVRSRNASGSGKERDMMRQTGPHTSKGVGRFAKALVQGPMDISMGMTKGFHNLPKLWGDDTVRPQAQVSGFMSGAKAAGTGFGLGLYDGISGLVTQPWKGAQKEGPSGFLKGIGKGLGGLITKPSAAAMGVPGYMMKGVHKELQKLYGSNVQNYIIASRTAQGYEDWLQSSEAEKQDVIIRWKLIQKYLKKKRNPDEMMLEVLKAQRRDTQARRDHEHTASSTQSNGTDAPTLEPETGMLVMGGGSQSSEESLVAAENESNRVSVQGTSCGDTGGNANADRAMQLERMIQDCMSELHRQRQEAADHQAVQVDLHRAMASSDNDEDDDEFERALRRSEKMAAVAGGLPYVQRPPSYDPGHLTGTTQNDFEARQQEQRGEKTAQEKTEEEIVMEYVKKQSLLEAHHESKGKGRATAMEDQDDEDLQTALKLSLQGHGIGYGEASRI